MVSENELTGGHDVRYHSRSDFVSSLQVEFGIDILKI